jgi:hypothetical protein
MKLYEVKLVLSPAKGAASRDTKLKIIVSETGRRVSGQRSRAHMPDNARKRDDTILDVEQNKKYSHAPDAFEVTERKREMEAAETAMESKNEAIERTMEKRFLQKQPPRKHTGQRGH